MLGMASSWPLLVWRIWWGSSSHGYGVVADVSRGLMVYLVTEDIIEIIGSKNISDAVTMEIEVA